MLRRVVWIRLGEAVAPQLDICLKVTGVLLTVENVAPLGGVLQEIHCLVRTTVQELLEVMRRLPPSIVYVTVCGYF